MSILPFLFLAISIVAIDRISKIIIFKSIPIGSSFSAIKGVLYLTPTLNKGAAFGLFKENSRVLLTAVSLLTTIFIIYLVVAKRPRSYLLSLSLILILGGAIGNLIDRIVYGYVLDFINIRVWPIFNIADSSISIGTYLILWHVLRNSYKT